MIRVTDRLIAPSRGTSTIAIAYARNNGTTRADFTAALLNTVYQLCASDDMPDAALVVARMADETGGDGGTVFCSPIYTSRGNPGGLGVTDGADEGISFDSPTAAARAMVAHTLLYATGDVARGGLAPADDPRYAAYRQAYANRAVAATLQDLQGKWFSNPHGAANTVARGNAIYPGLPEQQSGGSVTQFKTLIPGLPGPELETDYPIDTTTFMIPSSNTYQRPGIQAHTPRRSVAHGTGNPNSLAHDDANWVWHGADGIQESMHFECDDSGCYQLVPVDEVTWQAADGSGPGNMCGVSCEMTENALVWGNPARRDRAIHVAADLMGRIAARLNIASPEQHYTFNFADPNRHDCPNQLRHTMIGNQTAWDALYVPAWNAAKADELTRMNGGTVTPTTTPAPKPTTQYPPGMDEGVASWLFGSAKGKDGKTYSFNPTGVVSQAWLKYGDLWGFGELRDVWKFSDGREYFKFTTMTLWRPSATADFVPLETAQP